MLLKEIIGFQFRIFKQDDFNAIVELIKESNEEIKHTKKDKRIFIDQLLITGNGTNRFMSCEFSKGKIDYKTAKSVNPDDYFRKETVYWLHDNYSYVENSILTEEQRNKIRSRIVF